MGVFGKRVPKGARKEVGLYEERGPKSAVLFIEKKNSQRCSDGRWVSQILVHSNPTEGVFYAAIQIILGTV